jgi:hypothetical protein
MCAICPAHLSLPDLIILVIFVKRTGYKDPHYAAFYNLPPFPPS